MSNRDDLTDDMTIPFDALDDEVDQTDSVYGVSEMLLHAWAEGQAEVSGPSSTFMLRNQPMHPLPEPMLAMLKDWDGFAKDELIERELLGEGGMAVVYAADQQLPPRQVAVKRLRENTIEQAKQLFAEALLTGSLEHPNIIPVHAIRVDPKLGPEVVLKKVEGVSLSEAFESEGGTEAGLQRLLPKLIQVCNALEYAHARDIFHRDIKMENIMLGQYGEVYLLDWGIAINKKAKNINRGTVGTPHYIAPEMLSGDPSSVDARTDVYLLGATLHHLLVGQPRHNAPTSLSAAMLALKSEAYDFPPSVFGELGALANRACAFDPMDRPQTVAAFREGIEECLTHWAAMRTVRLAEDDYEFVVSSTPQPSGFETVAIRFDAAVLRLQSALASWPDCTEADTKLRTIRMAMAKHHLNSGDMKAARLLLNQVAPACDEERNEIKGLQEELERASHLEERVFESAAQNDLTQSSKGRRRASYAMLAIVALAVAATAYQQISGQPGRTAGEGLAIWLLGALLLLGAVVINRKAILRNRVGKRAMLILILAPILVSGIRVVTYIHGLDPVLIHPIETFAIANVCASSVEVFPRGPQFAVFAALLGVVGLLLPTFAYACFVTALLAGCTGFVWQWLYIGTSDEG